MKKVNQHIIRPLNSLKKLRFKQLISDLKEAIGGTEQDFTEGSMKRAIFLLAVPMVLEMIMESIFAVADIFFVSKLGPDAVATVGITESMITIVYAIGFGLSMATTALVSRRIGEKRPEEASRVALQAIITGIAASIPLALTGIFFSKELLKLMGASENIVQNMSGYAQIAIGSNTVIMMLFIINAIFRSAGDAAISMRVLIFANCMNLILDPLLIFGIGPFPELGVKGAAIATATGRGLAVLYQIYILLKGNKRVQLFLTDIAIDFSIIGKLIKLSLGNIAQNIIATSSWIGLMRIMSEFGSVAVAGYTIAIRIVIFALLPSWGLSNAASTLVGQNLGANKPKRAEKSVWVAGIFNMVLLGTIGIFFIIFSEFFIGLFISKDDVIQSGSIALQIVSCGFIFYGLGMVLMNSINGAGDTVTPTKFNLISFWLVEIPVAYLLAITFGFGEKGVFFAIIIAESLLTIIALVWFRKGKWQKIKV